MPGAREGPPLPMRPVLGEAGIVLAAIERQRMVPARTDLLRQGETPAVAHILLTGHTCRFRTLRDGRRQILAILVPGDLCDLEAVLGARADYGVSALTACTVGEIPCRRLADDTDAAMRAALWRHLLQDAAIAREWLVGMGRRNAQERLAHLFCELRVRLEAVGLAGTDFYETRITQVELADALGLTSVHVNRTLQELREAGLIRLANGRLTILDVPALERLAGFDPAYLRPGRALPEAERISLTSPPAAWR
ncbi:Crp/Fnr family transcriptional regulator [Methylobacterium trifolii]|uniref:HTH crp-type domain-containing protein n=1 Tax=Methylobacterium trifolii TaxID=1003092 RepID=A0ABQ4U3V2_9HYPH|nr:Crp/Fnr family transcriptional regulator [Methylobacterium trifolii]GJE62158.1 hypothetical protein MPOCJGCO_4288 [Methylobacterium trifolii]